MNTRFPTPSEPVIAVSEVSRLFKGKAALDRVSLNVARGSVLGLVGENGAGKTTLIKHLLGSLKAKTGTVRVFGLDPAADPVGTLSRIGYLSERRDLPGWMRVEELLRYTQAFYPDWDEEYAGQLLDQFRLNPRQLINSQSQGEQAKTGLLAALAYRPELLILDEPSSGLDPVVRRDILEAIIRAVGEDGRTIVFSSHLLDEVERVADHIVMLQGGRVVLDGLTDDVRGRHISAVLAFAQPQSEAPALAGAYAVSGFGSEWSVLFCGSRIDLERSAAALSARVLDERTPTLDEILVARAGGKGS